jgi:hypothetical protein
MATRRSVAIDPINPGHRQGRSGSPPRSDATMVPAALRPFGVRRGAPERLQSLLSHLPAESKCGGDLV